MIDFLPARLDQEGKALLQRRLASSLAGAALLLALGEGAASAATIRVNTKTPGIALDGKCSLIEAIENANDTATGRPHTECAAGDPAGADTIKLPDRKTITLTSVHNSTFFPTGLPVISSEITIEGNGSKIVRDPATAPFNIATVNSTGDLTLKKVTLSGGERAIFNFNYGILSIENSTISGNSSDYSGGGIFNYHYATLTIRNSTIDGNSAYYSGGGIFGYGTITITNTTISDNSAGRGGGGIRSYAVLTISNSTISGNSALGGGGIFNNDTATVTNSTVSGNSADVGGGIFNDYSAALTVENGTISGNSAAYFGGGVFNSISAAITFRNSLVSGNGASTSGPEVYNYSTGTVTADDFNLFGVSGISGVTGFSPGATDIVPAVPLDKIIGPLRKNGGPTKTHAVVKGSPAFNAVPLADPECTGADQRGVARPKGSGCDIGAFERK